MINFFHKQTITLWNERLYRSNRAQRRARLRAGKGRESHD